MGFLTKPARSIANRSAISSNGRKLITQGRKALFSLGEPGYDPAGCQPGNTKRYEPGALAIKDESRNVDANSAVGDIVDSDDCNAGDDQAAADCVNARPALRPLISTGEFFASSRIEAVAKVREDQKHR